MRKIVLLVIAFLLPAVSATAQPAKVDFERMFAFVEASGSECVSDGLDDFPPYKACVTRSNGVRTFRFELHLVLTDRIGNKVAECPVVMISREDTQPPWRNTTEAECTPVMNEAVLFNAALLLRDAVAAFDELASK